MNWKSKQNTGHTLFTSTYAIDSVYAYLYMVFQKETNQKRAVLTNSVFQQIQQIRWITRQFMIFV